MRESTHADGNYNTVSKNPTHRERGPGKHKKRAREKDTKRNPDVLRRRKAQRHTEVLTAKGGTTDVHACTHPLCCAGPQQKTPSRDPLPADHKLSTEDAGVRLGDGRVFSSRGTAGSDGKSQALTKANKFGR